MTEYNTWVDQILDLSDRITEADTFGSLHIVVSDGNMEDEHIEYCLSVPEISSSEIALAEDLLCSEYELRCFSYWLSRNLDARERLKSL